MSSAGGGVPMSNRDGGGKIYVMRNGPKLRMFQKIPPPAPASGGHYLLHTIHIYYCDTASQWGGI